MAQWMYGKQMAKQLLKEQGKVRKVLLAVNDPAIEQMAASVHVPVEYTDKNRLTKITGNAHHQGVALEVDSYKLFSVEDLIQEKKGKYGLIIMLDELEDPHNLGAILRTADAIQADGVIFKKDRSVGLTPTVAKVSAGAIDTVKCAAVTNLTRTCEQLKKKGYWIIGTDMNGTDYRALNYDFNAVLIIGNEGKGISRLLKETCDYTISLPMKGQISSLNASVSAGILMYAISAKRDLL